jgi:hypothetical protein
MTHQQSHLHIQNIKHTRAFLLDAISMLDGEALNIIPEGFNNNIIWNIGHLIASQYGICYLRSNNQLPHQDIFNLFKVGSKPERIVTDEEILDIKKLLLSSLENLKEDLNTGKLNSYTPWTTRYGVEIKTIEDGIAFLPYHEGMHMGYIMALKRIIAQVG